MSKCKNCGYEKFGLPRVFTLVRNKGTKEREKILEIVYSDRVERYILAKSETGKSIQQSNEQEDEWNPFKEITLMEESGFREVHAIKCGCANPEPE